MQEKDLYVLKVGAQTLIDEDGVVRDTVITKILESAKSILEKGNNVLIVTSGAVYLGRVFLKDRKASKTISASIGQPLLFAYYQNKARDLGINLAEFLITRPYVIRREQFLNLQNTFNELLNKGIIPIVNENDALVSGTDWSFGDNDSLASALAISLNAKKLILISHVDGLFDDDPENNPKANFICEVDNISDQFIKYCSNKPSLIGNGGMLSKLKVARICSAVGIETQIINGVKSNNILQTIEGVCTGTRFLPRQISGKITNRDRWILAAKNSAGSIEVDDGAVKALLSGASLLAVGVKKINGQFNEKEVIEIVDKNARGIAFGIVDFSHSEIENLIKNKDTHKNQLIHANNMFILK